MYISEFEITIYFLSPNNDGYIIYVDSEPEDEGWYLCKQSTDGRGIRDCEFHFDEPHNCVSLKKEAILEIEEMVKNIKFSFEEPDYPTKLAVHTYGIEVVRGLQKVTLEWQGQSDLTNDIKSIYERIRVLDIELDNGQEEN